MSRRRTIDLARMALTDATVVVELGPAAITNLDLGLQGWPEHTPGASQQTPGGPRQCRQPDCDHRRPPCPLHGDASTLGPATLDRTHQLGHMPTTQLTATERFATTPDKARRDLDAFHDHIRRLAHHAREAAKIAANWQLGLNEQDIRDRLVSIDAQIWCAHCSTYDRHEPRKRGKEHCDFCDGFAERKFKRTNGDTPLKETGVYTLPPKEIWDARDARNGRLDETTIVRILKAVDVQRRLDNIARKAREKAERDAAKLAEAG